MRSSCRLLVCLASALAAACSSSPSEPPAAKACGAYPAWQESLYQLPYPVGTAHLLIQGNCSGGSHQDSLRFAYDFEMPIGTLLTAARAGTVIFVEEGFADGDPEFWHSNVVQIEHGDGTTATYAHLTRDGALVEVGQRLAAGDPIALSGNTGYTLGVPHLHFDVAPCPTWWTCGTLAVTFRNTDPNPAGLQAGVVYPAYRPGAGDAAEAPAALSPGAASSDETPPGSRPEREGGRSSRGHRGPPPP
jgi:murein DD-endopeptidase MepM/ murein hydrolase activator NlpD